MKSPKTKLFGAVLGLIVLGTACKERPFYETFAPVNKAGWYTDSIASFEFEVEDTLSSYRVFLNFRANNDYPYSNLYLFRRIYSEQGLEYSDTANLIMADAYGKWLGEGLGELKTFKRVFRRQPLRFTHTGTYRFEIVQAMREDPLIGVEDIGISIYKELDGKAED